MSAELRPWLDAKCRDWSRLVDVLERIPEERNPAAHGESEVDIKVTEVHALCQRAMDLLVS
jgi:hypothetical protein